MGKWFADAKKLYQNKAYLFLLALTAACGYGFKIMHPVMGIDDTPYKAYFEEGLAAIVGRWVLFLLNKLVHISDFAPVLTDLAAVLLLMAAVTVWALLFYSVFQDKIPVWGYWFFSCIFLSCPLIGEVFTYFLHNGIAIGYLSCGISLCMLREGVLCLENAEKELKKKAVLPLVGAVCFMVVAMGCYESFMVVWIMGALLLFLAERLAGTRRAVFWKLCAAAGLAAVGMLLRSVVVSAVIGIFRLGYLREEAVRRSVGEMLGWMFESGAGADFAMALKRMFVMYGVFAYAYYPIKIFVLASVVIAVFCLWQCIRRRDAWIALLMLGSFLVMLFLPVVEGKATLYRAAQFVPLVCAFGILLLCRADTELGEWIADRGAGRVAAKCSCALAACVTVLLSVTLWNQCADLNKWFYVDYKKYEYSRELVSRIAYELEKNYDTSKPVYFAGQWECPKSIIGDAYVDYGTETFFRMKRITDKVDGHLLEKFYRGYGVWVAQTPALSVIDWGRQAFDTDEELVRFFAHHGYELVPFPETERYEEIEQYAVSLPEFPRKGSIVDLGDVIVVHL